MHDTLDPEFFFTELLPEGLWPFEAASDDDDLHPQIVDDDLPFGEFVLQLCREDDLIDRTAQRDLIGTISIKVVVHWDEDARALEFCLWARCLRDELPLETIEKIVQERNLAEGRLSYVLVQQTEGSPPELTTGFTTHLSIVCLDDNVRWQCKLSDLREHLIAIALQLCTDIRALSAAGTGEVVPFPARLERRPANHS